MASREGRFRARVIERGVSQQGENKLATAVLKFALTEEAVPEGWNDIQAEMLEIVGWFYFEKKDHSVNTFTFDALGAAFGWDKAEIFWFEDAPEVPDVQVTLAFDTYTAKDGTSKTSLKVKWINAYDSEAGQDVPKSDKPTRDAITARLGSKLRALYGGSKPAAKAAPAPSAPKTPPVTPTSTPKPPAAPAPTESACNADTCWKAMTEWASANKVNPKMLEIEWFRILKEVGGTQNLAEIEDWAAILEAIQAVDKLPI
jgi:hypothetical protein